MNKRDFYKELMSEYMFDKEKICANAKKGKLTGRRPLPIYIGMTAAVAAAVVIVGTVVFTNIGRNDGVQISNKTLAALSDKERLDRAISEIQRNEGSAERMDVYITFRTRLSPKAAQNLLSQFSGSPAKMLHMADGSRAMGTSEVAAVFRSNSGEVIAAIINCEGCKLAQINANENVVLAEPVSENDNFAEIKPLNPDLNTPDVSTPDTSTSVPEPTKPVVSDPDNNNSNTHEPLDIDAPSGDLPGGAETQDPDPNGTSSDTSDPDNNTSTSEPNVPEDPNNTSDPIDPGTSDVPPVTPDDPPAAVPGIPNGVTLPYENTAASFITDDLGAQKAYFLSENVFYVKSENAVSLYKWDGKKETLAATQTIADAKVTWVSENGLRMMVSGTENGVRKKLYIIDAKNCTINDMNVDEAVGEGSIAEAAYNEKLDVFALNVFDVDCRYIYTAKLLGYQISEPQIIAYGSENLSLLAAHGKAVYYSESMGTSTVIYKYENGKDTEVKVLDSLYVSALNSAFTHSLVIGTNSLNIFDPEIEGLIPITGDKISFGASAHSFSDGKSYFTIKSGAIVPESGISEIAKIDFTRSFSAKWAAVVSNGSVRIIPGVYTERVKTSGITFAQPEEKATAQQRVTVNTALGVINALANGSCKECGLNTSEKLIAAIDACFSSSEARYIKAKCEISETGELSCTNGGFTAANVSDTVLVMNDELNGTLYIKVGTFDGKTAYRTVSVALTNENGKLLMDAAV